MVLNKRSLKAKALPQYWVLPGWALPDPTEELVWPPVQRAALGQLHLGPQVPLKALASNLHHFAGPSSFCHCNGVAGGGFVEWAEDPGPHEAAMKHLPVNICPSCNAVPISTSQGFHEDGAKACSHPATRGRELLPNRAVLLESHLRYHPRNQDSPKNIPVGSSLSTAPA